jgi:hypothetical protein
MMLGLLALPAASMAQGEPTGKGQTATSREARPEEPPLLRPRASGFGGAGPAGPVTDKEMEAVSEFMAKYAPNRWHALQDLPDDGALRRGVMNFVVARYRQLKEIRDEDERLYEIKLKQLVAEDEIYGLVAPLKSPGERDLHRDDIKVAVRKLLALNQEERQRRVERIKQSLDSEERRMAAEREHQDQLVEARTTALVVDGTSALRRDVRRNESEPARRPGVGAPAEGSRAPQRK